MKPDRWTEIGRVFEAAHSLAAEKRGEFLESACGADADLRAEVESLLSAHDDSGDFLETPPIARAGAPRAVGPWELVREIGEGGMGVVWEAHRSDQGFTRRVALKLVKPGMDTAFVLRRFESERRILASLDHPNIAAVLDGGSTDDGRPYFVMELIEGRTLLAYCEEEGLPLAARLALFRQVCAAVQYAHQRLVIHRDLKPGNILVTSDGVPKLLDFGLAKVLARTDVETVARTETIHRALTPEYASPEQVRGDVLTTATDVYSLGVVLYELVTGARPYRLRTKGAEELAAAVLTQEPERPSTRAALPKDLDAIVLAALRKEPARRYGSVEQLSEDLRRLLSGLPVKARPDSFRYRAGKFALRHRASLVAGAVVVGALVAAAVISYDRARVARAERDRAQATARFLAEIFQAANPVESHFRTLTARDLLDRGTARIAKELAGDPELRASLLLVMSDAYERLDVFDRALALAEESLALRERRHAGGDPPLAEALERLGHLERRLGRAREAAPLLTRAVAIREARGGPELASALRELAVAKDDLGDGGEARRLLQRGVAILENSASNGLALAITLNSLANVELEADETANAARTYERAVAIFESAPREESWRLALPLVNLGSLARNDERFDDAERFFARALALNEASYGKESVGVAYVDGCLGDLARAEGDRARARELLDRSIALYEKLLSRDAAPLATPLTALAEAHLDEGHAAETFPLLARALAIAERAHGAEHATVAEILVVLSRARLGSGSPAEAEAAARRALAIQRKALPPSHRALVPTLTALARALRAQSRAAEARPLLEEAVAVARAKLREGHTVRANAERELGAP